MNAKMMLHISVFMVIFSVLGIIYFCWIIQDKFQTSVFSIDTFIWVIAMIVWGWIVGQEKEDKL